ncbi:general substrate transporter [Auriculariales sp. MPI-PUGE-AT-0066]|nr:general substrate transporter [Auriculariales sp. MPI-PUGE-AT-0066]
MSSATYTSLPLSSSAGASTRTFSHGGSITLTSSEPLQYTYAFRRTRVVVVCALFAALGGLTFGYDQGVIANVLVMPDFVRRFPVTPAQIGWMTAVLELGAMIGALSASFAADTWSRRYAICIASVIFCIGSAMQAGASSFGFLTAGRAIGGFGIGALSMCAPLYISEISAPDVRGRLLALEQLTICVGVVLGFWTGYFTHGLGGSFAWRLPLAIQILPGIVLGFGCLLLPPSPRFLILKGDTDGARRSLSRLRDVPEDDDLLHLELLEIRIDVQLSQDASWSALWHTYRSRTLIGVGLGFFQQWTGINALLYYGPTLMAKLGLNSPLLGAGGIGIVQALAAWPAIALIDTAGRRPLYIYGAGSLAILHLGVAGLTWRYDTVWDQYPAAGYTAVALLYIFTAVYGVSLGPITWVLPAEIFPTSVRSRGVALSTASTWFNNFLVGLSTPVLVERSAAATYALFAVACVFATIWSVRTLPETRGLALEEIDKALGVADASTMAGESEADYRRKVEEQHGLPQLVRELLEPDAEEDGQLQ